MSEKCFVGHIRKMEYTPQELVDVLTKERNVLMAEVSDWKKEAANQNKLVAEFIKENAELRFENNRLRRRTVRYWLKRFCEFFPIFFSGKGYSLE